MNHKIPSTNCPCGLIKAPNECCAAIISGQKDALTCEELMRSRYVAFTTANVDYLMRSQHSHTRQPRNKKKIQQWAKSVKWVGLTIIGTKKGLSTDMEGYIEFRALYFEDGQVQMIHENSFFQREKGKWVYVSPKP